MNINESFLNEYKSLEETCRDLNIDLKDLADQLGDVDGNKLNICRQMRNYMSHNSEKHFISATNFQVKFLMALNKEMKERDDTCAKHLLKRLNSFSCSSVEKCSEVILRMSQAKATHFLVLGVGRDQEVIVGAVSIFEVAKGLAATKTARIKDVPLDKGVTIGYVAKTCKYKDVPDNSINICTDNGEPDSKILGVVI